jgi:hypothetical protein
LCTTTWKTNSEYQLDSIVRYPFEPLFSPLHHNGNAHTRSRVCVYVCVGLGVGLRAHARASVMCVCI